MANFAAKKFQSYAIQGHLYHLLLNDPTVLPCSFKLTELQSSSATSEATFFPENKH